MANAKSSFSSTDPFISTESPFANSPKSMKPVMLLLKTLKRRWQSNESWTIPRAPKERRKASRSITPSRFASFLKCCWRLVSSFTLKCVSTVASSFSRDAFEVDAELNEARRARPAERGLGRRRAEDFPEPVVVVVDDDGGGGGGCPVVVSGGEDHVVVVLLL